MLCRCPKCYFYWPPRGGSSYKTSIESRKLKKVGSWVSKIYTVVHFRPVMENSKKGDTMVSCGRKHVHHAKTTWNQCLFVPSWCRLYHPCSWLWLQVMRLITRTDCLVLRYRFARLCLSSMSVLAGQWNFFAYFLKFLPPFALKFWGDLHDHVFDVPWALNLSLTSGVDQTLVAFSFDRFWEFFMCQQGLPEIEMNRV